MSEQAVEKVTINGLTGYPAGKCWECDQEMVKYSWIGTTVIECGNCGQSDEYEEE